MARLWLLPVGLLALLAGQGSAKIYNKCELAKELRSKYGFPASQIPTLVCIARYESAFDTSAINKKNSDGSWDYGLFQFNNRWWCDRGAKGCAVPCATLLSDMSAVAKCVRRVYDETKRLRGDGYLAWVAYSKHCKTSPEREVQGCTY